MRVRDGPAAVRGDAPPPRSHWREPGRRRGREPRVRRPAALLHNRTPRGRRIQVLRSSFLVAALLAAALVLHVAGASGGAAAPTQFPVTITTPSGKVTVTSKPRRIVSLSPTATESLFAIGAGPQVVAVDDQSDYPKAAPKTTLSGFTPNVEAIASYRPDLVVIAFDTRASRPRCEGWGSRSSTTTARRRWRARTSRSASSGSSRGTPSARPVSCGR